MRLIKFCRFTFLLLLLIVTHNCIGMKRDLAATIDDSEKFDSPYRFFYALPNNIVTKIVAQTHRNALRKTCKLFAAAATINNLINLILHPDFKGTIPDVLKACEHCIEVNDHTTLEKIITKYSLNELSQANIIGYSLPEYALLLNKSDCFCLLSPQGSIQSIEYRCRDFLGQNNRAFTLNKDDLIADKMHTLLLNTIYIHRATKNTGIVQNLLNNSSIKGQDFAGECFTLSPLHVAAYQDDSKLVELLIPTQKVNLSGDVVHKYTALHVACMRGYQRCIEALLAAGSDPNLELSGETRGKTALCQAAQRRFTECARVILNSNKLVNKTKQCQLALLYATQAGSAEIVELLLAQKTNPDIPINIVEKFDEYDSNASQPIEWAVIYGDIDIINQLLAAGAEVTNHALHLAQENNHPEILCILQRSRF